MEATIKITVSKLSEEEIEVKLPAYRKSNCHFFKVISPEHCICITDLSSSYTIQQFSSSHAFSISNSESTEEEFIDKYNEVKNKLEDLALKS